MTRLLIGISLLATSTFAAPNAIVECHDANGQLKMHDVSTLTPNALTTIEVKHTALGSDPLALAESSEPVAAHIEYRDSGRAALTYRRAGAVPMLVSPEGNPTRQLLRVHFYNQTSQDVHPTFQSPRPGAVELFLRGPGVQHSIVFQNCFYTGPTAYDWRRMFAKFN